MINNLIPFLQVTETPRPILPPPPSSKRGHLERQQTIPATPTSTTSSPAPNSAKSPPPQTSGSGHWFDKETEKLFIDEELSNIEKNNMNSSGQYDDEVTN